MANETNRDLIKNAQGWLNDPMFQEKVSSEERKKLQDRLDLVERDAIRQGFIDDEVDQVRSGNITRVALDVRMKFNALVRG
jgi:hypothetical protein